MLKLSKKKEYRQRVLRNLATNFIIHERIETTTAKAKTLKPLLMKLIRYSMLNDLASRRNTAKILFTAKSVKKLFEDLPPRYLEKDNSKNIRFYPLNNRGGDNAPMTQISLNLKSLESIIKEEEKQNSLKNNKKDEIK